MSIREQTEAPSGDAAGIGVVAAAVRRYGSSSIPGLLRDYGIVVVLLALFLFLAVSSRAFTSRANLLNILDQQSPILIMAAAGTLVVIAGGIDLSAGATFALSGVVGAQVANQAGPVLGLLVALMVGLGVGLVNGLLITYGRIEALIGTLATSFAIAGLSVIASGGRIVVVVDPQWRSLGTGEIFGIRYSICIAVLYVALNWTILTKTVFGRHVFAVGGNEQAAWLSGVHTPTVRIVVFGLSGLSAGLAGVIVASRVGSGASGSGISILFVILAGIIIGGTSISGGFGAVWRTVVGVLFLALIHNGFTVLGLNTTYEQVVAGGLIVLAVAVDAWTRHPPRAAQQ